MLLYKSTKLILKSPYSDRYQRKWTRLPVYILKCI